jgi:hypothetical protein
MTGHWCQESSAPFLGQAHVHSGYPPACCVQSVTQRNSCGGVFVKLSLVRVLARNYLRRLLTEVVVCFRLDFWVDICGV